MTEFICGVKPINLGLDINGIAYQKPTNPLGFDLENIKYGIAMGRVMKATPTGTKLPNPTASLAKFFKSKPPTSVLPKVAPVSINQYTVNRNTNRYANQLVRAQAARQLRARARGILAVSQQPNVLRRELQADRSYAVTRPVGYDNEQMQVRPVAEADAPIENNDYMADINRMLDQMNLIADEEEAANEQAAQENSPIANRVMRRRRNQEEKQGEIEETKEDVPPNNNNVGDDEQKQGEIENPEEL